MNGDRPGAERIATTMMPPGMARGCSPFFERLPRLSAIDRAFAVHFGEVRPNATRIADAQRVPSLPALTSEPNPFPAVAAAQVAAADTGRKSKRDKKKLAAAVIAANRTAYVAPLPRAAGPDRHPTGRAGREPPAIRLRRVSRADQSRGDGVAAARRRLSRATGAIGAGLSTDRADRHTISPASDAADESGDEGPDEAATAPAKSVAPAATFPGASSTDARIHAAGPVGRPAATTFSPQPTQGDAALAPTPTSGPTFGRDRTDAAASRGTGPASRGHDPATVVLAATSASMPTAAATPAPEPVAIAAQPAMSTSGPPLVVPPPVGSNGDAVLAAIVANISVPDAELRPTEPAQVAPSALLTVVEKRADPVIKSALAAATQPRGRPGAKPVLTAADLRKDGKGRFIDAQGRPLLTGKGVPMDARAAISWLTTRDPAYAATLAKADDEDVPALPKKNARGHFVDARGRPLLDARGRPLTEKAAATWAATQDKLADAAPAKGKADALPKKDARGRFVDAKGKPLLDARGRPMDAKQAAAWLAAGGKTVADKKDTPEKAEPARIWVQVAGGANEDMLSKEWARVQGQSAALKGKQGWTTPLRATNRVLTGPYKTSAEAMARREPAEEAGRRRLHVHQRSGPEDRAAGGEIGRWRPIRPIKLDLHCAPAKAGAQTGPSPSRGYNFGSLPLHRPRAPYASDPAQTRGRLHPEPSDGPAARATRSSATATASSTRSASAACATRRRCSWRPTATISASA